jgi:DNA mismatch repair protein PMS2
VVVENIFKNLPVRRQELNKNIKREYGKVLNLLQAYACVSTLVKFGVSNIVSKKKTQAFSTQANKTVRENIANVFGQKTVAALTALELEFEMQSTAPGHAQGDEK